jgi:hypothetical protein
MNGTARVLAIGHSRYGASRAEQLLTGVADARVEHAGPGTAGARRAVRAILASDADIVYLVDVGVSTSAAAAVARLMRRRVIVDTGDLAYELARSTGARSPGGLAAVWAGERAAITAAHLVVVRGEAHRVLLGNKPTTCIPDVAPSSARPVPGKNVRRSLGLDGTFVVGLVGSLKLAPRLGTTYGWDLIEALALLPERVHALIVGNGDGLSHLRERARVLGVEARCRFAGFVDPKVVAEHIGAMDVAISTQTNDAIGAVRTTGKLPLYLACGCPVVASHVGEAGRILGPHGWTVRYDGVVDLRYPERLAERILTFAEAGPEHDRKRRALALETSQRCFSVDEMRQRIADAIATVAS